MKTKSYAISQRQQDCWTGTHDCETGESGESQQGFNAHERPSLRRNVAWCFKATVPQIDQCLKWPSLQLRWQGTGTVKILLTFSLLAALGGCGGGGSDVTPY